MLVILIGKIITLHSYKGGTGKTLISMDLAQIIEMKGKNVCLLDLDFRSPSLAIILGIKNADYWLNDYLNGVCDIEKALIDLTEKKGNAEKFLIGLANPSMEAIREISAKDRKWYMRALGRLLALRNSLIQNMGIDYLLLDASSGVEYNAVNAIVCADMVLIILTMDAVDTYGARRMIRELYDLFEKKTAILLNKVPIVSKDEAKSIARKFETLYGIPVLGVIPFFDDVHKNGLNWHFLKENPEHPLKKNLEYVAKKIGLPDLKPLTKVQKQEMVWRYKQLFVKKITGFVA